MRTQSACRRKARPTRWADSVPVQSQPHLTHCFKGAPRLSSKQIIELPDGVRPGASWAVVTMETTACRQLQLPSRSSPHVNESSTGALSLLAPTTVPRSQSAAAIIPSMRDGPR